MNWKVKLSSSLRVFRALAVALVLLAPPLSAAEQVSTGQASGLPVPRFVSLKSDRVNVRGGPTKDHEVSWIYTRSGLPVEVTAEFENWRRIRDWEGAEGWVYHSLLSGRRTAIITPDPKKKNDLFTLRDSADVRSDVVARMEPGVLGSVKKCADGWCRLTGAGFDGWMEQERLWGVYPNENLD